MSEPICVRFALRGPFVLLPGGIIVVGVFALPAIARFNLRMARYPQNAGAAAALFGSSQFGFGMWASAAVSYTHDGSGRPMAWVILVTAALSLAGYLLFRRASR